MALEPLQFNSSIGLGLDEPLPTPIGSPAEKGNAFRDFALRVGGGKPTSLLGVLSSAFGQGTEEIAARKRAQRRQQIEDQIFEKQARDILSSQPAPAKRQLFTDAAGFTRDAITGKRVAPDAVAKAEKASALQEKINTLVGQGIPLKTATGIATGQYVSSRDPVTGEAQIIDKATGRLVRVDEAQPTDQPIDQPIDQPTDQPDISEALGGGAVVKTAINKIADLFGGNLPFEETSIAAAQLSNLNNDTIQSLRAGLGGKPNIQLQKRIEKLMVEPNEIFGGEAEAKNKFQALINTLNTESARIQRDIEAGGMRPVTLDKARQTISELNGLSNKYAEILKSITPKDRPPIESFFR